MRISLNINGQKFPNKWLSAKGGEGRKLGKKSYDSKWCILSYNDYQDYNFDSNLSIYTIK